MRQCVRGSSRLRIAVRCRLGIPAISLDQVLIGAASRFVHRTEFALRGIKILDDRIYNPTYAVLLVTGILTALEGHWSFGQLWIALGIGLYVLLAAIAAIVFTPSLRKQIEVLASEGRDSPRYAQLAARVQASGAVLGVIVIGVVFIMVTKPTI